MPGDDDVIIMRHNNIAAVKKALAAASDAMEDGSAKEAVLAAISSPTHGKDETENTD